MDSHMRLMSLRCLVLVLGFVSGADGAVSHHVMKKIITINKKGPYLGIVVPNSFEMSPLLQSPSFVADLKLPHLDFSGRRFRFGLVGNEKVIMVMTGLSMLNAGITTQLLLSLFRVKGVVHFGIAGNANPDLQIGDATIPQYWAHSGLWNWQRYGDGPEDELAFESSGDYTRKVGCLKFSDYNNNTKNGNPSDNLLNNIWYQPEEIFRVNETPEIRQHIFWVPVNKRYFSLTKSLKGMKLPGCVNSTCLPRTPIVTRVRRGISANVFVDNRAYREFMYSKFNATAIDMESAAVALVCQQQEKPFIAIRALSDLAGGGSSVSNEAAIFASLAAQNAVDVVIFLPISCCQYGLKEKNQLNSTLAVPEAYPSSKVLTSQRSSRTLKTSPKDDSDSGPELSSDDNLSNYSALDSESEIKEKNEKLALFNSRQSQSQTQKQPISAESSCPPDLLMAEIDSQLGGGKNTPPKDFVCPITSHIFDDPVTLETGQTYEREAIQEWLDRGNSTCPITRQKLQSTRLPKTNYVLKRLIASWQEKNPSSVPIQSENSHPESEPVFNSMVRSTSPNSVVNQATIDGTVSELRLAITNLCMSEILKESEMAVLQIERFWQEAKMELEIQTLLSKPPVINGFVEILINSVDPRVLRATVVLLSELGSRDSSVIQTLTRVDTDVKCVVALFKKGLLEAVVLIYLLRPSSMSLIEMEILDTLLKVIRNKEDDMLKMCMKPKTAAVLLLGQILGSTEAISVSEIARRVITAKVIESIVTSLQADSSEERIAAVGILLRCMQVEGTCRNIIADKAELAPVLESFMGAKDGERFEIVHFLSELVKLNRRTFNEQVLHIIKDEGTFSTMHTLLVYLQTALQDQSPIVAGLLLQLDLLEDPRKMSIYREEAIDTLISCLRNSDFPAAQIAAAETILALQGRFSSSGKPLVRLFLLKQAGLDKNYKSLMRKEQLNNLSGEEEENASEEWERKMAFVLVSHEFGLVFEALAEGLKSRYAELCSACFASATWLVHMLNVLPDTGIRGAARVCLLKPFVSIFISAKDTEDRVLSMLALNSFISDTEGRHDITSRAKDILKGLRDLKKSSTMAFDMMKVFSEGNDSSAKDLWNHKELVQEDCSVNGAVLSIVCFRDKIFSGHSDGTIKVWTGRGSIMQLVQETREHTKAVTSLAIRQSGDSLYSGSLDRSVRVWTVGSEVMHCTQVHDMKDQVNNLAVANSLLCFIPQGAGIKVHTWSGGFNNLNPNKNAKCLAFVDGKLYCGCLDNSIQEIDLATGDLSTIQSGSRKLLGKGNPIYVLHVRDGLIYSASSSLDGAAVKIWSASNYSMVGSLPSTLEVRAMATSAELIYLGCKGGIVEVWCRKKHNRVDTLQAGTNAKILCMALDANEEVLVIGAADGRIQAWGLT